MSSHERHTPCRWPSSCCPVPTLPPFSSPAGCPAPPALPCPTLPCSTCSDFFLRPENYKGCESLLVSRFGEFVRKLWNPRAFKGQVSPHELMQVCGEGESLHLELLLVQSGLKHSNCSLYTPIPMLLDPQPCQPLQLLGPPALPAPLCPCIVVIAVYIAADQAVCVLCCLPAGCDVCQLQALHHRQAG